MQRLIPWTYLGCLGLIESIRANCLPLCCDVEPLDQYLRTFSWNKVKYRADRPLAELIDLLQRVGLHITHPTLPFTRPDLTSFLDRRKQIPSTTMFAPSTINTTQYAPTCKLYSANRRAIYPQSPSSPWCPPACWYRTLSISKPI